MDVTQDPTVRAMSRVWGNWKQSTLSWFITEFDADQLRSSCSLLVHYATDLLPRPRVEKIRKAVTALKRRCDDGSEADLRAFYGQAPDLVAAWVERHCSPLPNCSIDPQSACRYQKLLTACAAELQVSTGTVAGWVQDSLYDVGAWRAPFSPEAMDRKAEELGLRRAGALISR